MPSRRALGIGLAIVVVLFAVFEVRVRAWATARLEAAEKAWRAWIDEERARAKTVTHPVLFGQAVPDNAAAIAKRALGSIGKDLSRRDAQIHQRLVAQVDAGPLAPIDSAVLAMLELHRADVALVRSAAGCTGCDWGYDWERGLELPVIDLPPAKVLGQLSTIAAFERARTGDGRDAARRLLETARLGVDLAEGPLLSMMIGTTVQSIAYRSLAALLASDVPGVDAQEVARALELLEPHAPRADRAFRVERAALGALGRLSPSGLRDLKLEDLGNGFLPRRVLLAHAIDALAPVYEDWQKIAATPDRNERRRGAELIRELSATTNNPVVTVLLPNLDGAVKLADNGTLRHRLALAAARVEAHRKAKGAWPADESAIALPDDPYVPRKKLRYARTPSGWKLWSAGENERDEGGVPGKGEQGDVVLERTAGRAPVGEIGPR